MREVLDPVPTPPSAERVVTPLGGRAPRRPTRRSPRRRSSRRSPLRRPELVVLAAPFALLVALGVRMPAPRAPGVGRLDRERALEGDERRRDRDRAAPSAAVDRLEVGLALPDGVELAEGEQPRRAPPRRGRRARARAPPALRTLGLRGDRRRPGSAHATGSGSRPARSASSAAARCASTPTPERLRRLVAPAQTQATIGQRGRARARGRARVRRHAAVRPRRPRALGQLAGERAPRRASSSTSATRSATRTSCCSSTASPRRARADEGTLEHAVRAAATLVAELPASAATASASSRSAASCAGSSPAAGSCSTTASSTRCSRPASSSAMRGRTST